MSSSQDDLLQRLRAAEDDIDRLKAKLSEAQAVIHVVDKRVDVAVEDIADSLTDYPKSFPVVPVTFVGPYTDDFNTTDFLTGPYTYQGSGAAFSAGGYLSLSVTAGGSPEWVYAGRAGGAFLPKDSGWTVIAKVTQCDTVYNKAGLGIDDQDFADGIQFDTNGRCSFYIYRQTSSITRVYCVDSTSDYVDVAQLPTRSVPLYLKVAWDASAGTLTYSYRWGDTGSYTTIATHTVGTTYWSDKCDCGPLGGSTGTTNIDVELDNIEVTYTPEEAVSEYAFIPTAAFSGYQKNYVYVKQSDGVYKEIEPQSWMIVSAYGSFWRYDDASAAWMIYRPLAAPITHGIDDTTYHDGVAGADEDDIMVFDANALPKSGAKSIAEILTEVTDLQAKTLALLATLNHNRLPGYVNAVHNNLDVDTTLQIPETAANDAPTLDNREVQLWIDSDDSDRAWLIVKSLDTGKTYGVEVSEL